MALQDFNKIEIANAFQFEVMQSAGFSVKISADDNLFDYLDVRNDGGTLHIGLKPGNSYFNTTQKAAITLPSVVSLNVSGASKGKISGFNSTGDMELELSGASELNADNFSAGKTTCTITGASTLSGNMKTADISAEISGASTLDLKGSGGNAAVNASGASHARLSGFPVTGATVNLSGASDAAINTNGDLNADLSGASRLTYTGNPRLGRIEPSGASSINPG